jgi:hypothetical protein
MSTTIRCDKCRGELETGDDTYCESCYNRLEIAIEDLKTEMSDLKTEIEKLKGE